MGILCQNCKQAKATVHLTDIQPDGEPVERHLCEQCANQEGVTLKPHEPINLMLEKFVKLGADLQEAAERTCPECGMTFGEFRSLGQLGCPNDYKVFADLLMPLIERAHDGGSEHVGKVPGRADSSGKKRAEIHRLRRELDRAVESEDYEKAAKLRDRLKEMAAGSSDEH